MLSYGINKSVTNTTEMDYHLEEFYTLGYTIVENVLTTDELTLLRSELHRAYEVQEAEFGKENMDLINDKNNVRAPLCYSEAYVALAKHPKMLEYVKKILGNYFLLHLQNGVVNMPNEAHHQSSWHRDFPYQNWVASEPIGCNIFYCLDDFNEETGGTIVLPFSHKVDHAPSERYMNKHAAQVVAPAGSVIVFDSMLFHRAGYNRSGTQIRRGVNNLYARGIVRQQINLPEMLGGKYADDAFLSMLLGYDAQSAGNVMDFRSRRLKRNKKDY